MDKSKIDSQEESIHNELFFGGDNIALSSAILVGTFKGGKERDLCSEHLNELEDLATTFGLVSLSKLACPIRKYEASTYIGKGKVQEIAELAESSGATCVIFDEEILPSQQRNLEKQIQIPVLDRTELILGIFAQRAQTKEARLQVQLAQLKYKFPRLKRLWTHLSRQRGGGGHLKGEGEKQIELDKRMLKQKMSRITDELKSVQLHRETQRQLRKRAGVPIFGIVGYTNAGKSTLLNTLTSAGVFVEDKLFATLDTSTRRFTLPNQQSVLLIDTVGFIRKIPHTVVAAFRSTLEEALHADILLHLVDVSNPLAMEQAEASFEVFKELKVKELPPIITVLNKIDRVENPQSIISQFRIKYSKTVVISAKTGEGLEEMAHLMEKEIEKLRQLVRLRIPQKEYNIVSEIQRIGLIHTQEYEGNEIIIKAEIPTQNISKFESYFIEKS